MYTLIFSQADVVVAEHVHRKASIRGALGEGAVGTGDMIVLADDGKPLSCTSYFNLSKRADCNALHSLIESDFPMDTQDVADLRIVRGYDGKAVNEEHWKKWGYDPNKSSPVQPIGTSQLG